MSFNRPNVYGKLASNVPLNTKSVDSTIPNDGKTITAGIMSNGASAIRSTPTSNVAQQKPAGNLCSTCQKPVYFAEEVRAAGQLFHKLCYKCTNCKKSISGGNFSEHDGHIYDNNCYQRLFGPKGVGFGIGAGTLSTSN